MAPASVDLSEFRLLRALRAGQAGAWPSLWNAFAGDIWSVFRALVDTDAEALGWMASLRLDLAEEAQHFSASESLAPQVGRVLLAHADAAFSAEGPLPDGPLTPDERGVRALPPRTRLRYLVDLFFDHSVEDPAVRRACALLEPSQDTDARMLVHAALLRAAPAAALVLPPGATPPRRSPWRWFVPGVALGTVLMVGWWLVPRDWDALGAHTAAFDAPGAVVFESDPADLGLRLSRNGVTALLTEVPDLSTWGLSLLGARTERGAVILLYRSTEGDWSLQHVEAGSLPDEEPVARREGLEGWEIDGRAVVGWRENGSVWLLVAQVPLERALDVSAALRTHRAAPVPTPSSPFDALTPPPGSQ